MKIEKAVLCTNTHKVKQGAAMKFLLSSGGAHYYIKFGHHCIKGKLQTEPSRTGRWGEYLYLADRKWQGDKMKDREMGMAYSMHRICEIYTEYWSENVKVRDNFLHIGGLY
jgi:hypothetical protein